MRKFPINVTIDQGVNLKLLRSLQKQGKIKLYQVHDIEQIFKYVSPQGKAFTIGNSKIGGIYMLAADNIIEVQKIIGSSNKNDIQHIYSAYLNHSEYFITDNPDDFINQGKREKLERILFLKIRRTSELVDELENK